MIQLDRYFFMGIADGWLRTLACRAAVIIAMIFGALVVLAWWDATQGRIGYLEDRVATLEDRLQEPRPLFVVPENYQGHIFINGEEADH